VQLLLLLLLHTVLLRMRPCRGRQWLAGCALQQLRWWGVHLLPCVGPCHQGLSLQRSRTRTRQQCLPKVVCTLEDPASL